MPRINSFGRTVWKYDEWVSSQSEAVMIESRRRMDLALATLISVKPIWDKLEELENRYKSLEKTKIIKFVGIFGLIAVGLLLGFLLAGGSNEFNVGHLLALAGVYIWLIASYNRWLIYKSANELEKIQNYYLFNWIASVGNSDLFFAERLLRKDENKFDGVAYATLAERTDKRKPFDEKRAAYYHERHFAILCRVSGEVPSLEDSTQFY